ncbi:EAL domain-containing protein [Cohnella sp. GCM10027633]|uniref:EAL domain-containing protein n=1 Tax=unclassified Cohnella TaxID=2636738 RepID=UPI00363B240F
MTNVNRLPEFEYATPLQDHGFLSFDADNPGARALLREAIYEVAPSERMPLSIHYEDEHQLLRLLSLLQSRIQPEQSERIQCLIIADRESDTGWTPLRSLFGDVGGHSVADTILNRLFTSHMQPIVSANGAPVGYEFLLRPLPELPPFKPAALFEAARRTGQHAFLDRAARESAIRVGASHLRNGTKRFVNFLPSSLHDPDSCLRCTFDAIRETGTEPADYVFEVIETERLDDPGIARVFDVARANGVRLALDDVGTGFATLDTVDRLRPDYVKMDRQWVSGCDADESKQRYIEDLINRSARFGGTVLAEGVERAEEWDYLRRAGVPLLQGFLFGRAAPVPVGTKAGAH